MATVRLTWTDPNSGAAQEDEVRIYRDTAPFDIDTLPSVLDTLAADTLTYDDTTVVDDESYWYAVAFEKDGVLVASFTDEVVIEDAGPTLPNYFDGDFSTQTQTPAAIWPCAVYDATSNKTFYVWLAEGSPQLARIAAYDHSADVWSEAVTVDRRPSPDDTHGVPAIALDHQGYIYVFWGNHGGDQRWAISASPRDISAWNVQTPLSGTYTYPHPVAFGTDLYLFMRVGSTSDSKFIVRKASPSGGVASFGSEINLIDWTPDNVGVYVAEVRAIGSEIEMMWCQQTGPAPQVRRHLFYAAWNPSTGALRNLSSGVTVASGSLPISHATATASFREVDSGSNKTEIPSWCRPSSGHLHVVYFDGSSNPYALKHMIHDGTSWSSPTTVVSLNGRGVPRIRYVALVPAGSTVELWYPSGDTGGWTQVGGDNMARKVWASGSWGSEEIIVTGDGVHALAHPSAVHDADANLRVVFGESAQSEIYNDRFLAKRYGHGAGGLTEWPEVTDPYRSRLVEHVVYQGADNSTPANLDRSLIADPLTWAGNAKISGNRLALDGTGDYTALGVTASGYNRRYYMGGTANKNSGEFCIDLRRIKFANATQTACIWGRSGGSGSRSLLVMYRGELTPDQFSFEYSFNGTTLNNLRFNFSPDPAKEYDFRISRDATGKLRLHHGESGSDLVMVASATISTGEFSPETARVNHGAFNGGTNTMNGSIGGTRVTLSDRGTTDANIAAAEMAFDA